MVKPIVVNSVSAVESWSDVTLLDIPDVNFVVDSSAFSVVDTSVKSIVISSKVDPAVVLVVDCVVVG